MTSPPEVPCARADRAIRWSADDTTRRSRPARLDRTLASALLLSAAGVGLALVLFAVQSREAGAQAEALCRQGRQQIALDTGSSLRRATALFERAYVTNESPCALVGLSETSAAMAALLRESAGRTGHRPTDAVIRREIDHQLARAGSYAQAALSADPTSAGAHRAMANYLRVSGAPADAVWPHLRLGFVAQPPDPDAVLSAAALAIRDGNYAEARDRLERLSGDSAAAGYLLARAWIGLDHVVEAEAALRRVLQLSPAHARARALLTQIAAGR